MPESYSTFKLVFTLDSQTTLRTMDYYLPVNPNSRDITLNPALEDAADRGLPLRNCQVFYLDYLRKHHAFLGVFPFCREVRIPMESVINGTIQINLKVSGMPAGEMLAQMQDQTEENRHMVKNKKVKQRTIKQAIDAVLQWRRYYDTPDARTGRRLYTLDQAAKKVGIAKKTLDDYYNHLRIAQEFNFHLQRYSESKIGILRKFVKIAKEQGREVLEKQMPACIIDTDIQKYWSDFNQV